MVWWFAIPPLLVVGILAARGTRRFIPLVVATVVGTALLLEYLLTVAYAAPRFLLPTYALYSLPCAAGVGALATARLRPPLKAAVVVALVALLGAQVGSQTRYLRSIVAHNTTSRAYYLRAATTLRAHHVHAPCVIYGPFGPPVAFLLHCNDVPQAPAVLPRVATGTTVIEMTTAPGAGNPLPGSHPIRLFPTGPRHHTIAHILRARAM